MVGVMTRFFCGYHVSCTSPDPQPAAVRHFALQRAIHNMRHRYLWVGVLERFEDSLRLLKTVAPDWFGSLRVKEASKEHVRPSNSSSYAWPQQSTLDKLALENENDHELYRQAMQMLECRLKTCSGMAPNEPTAIGMRPNAAAEQLLGAR